jgi:hypothetical protein
LFKTGYDGFKKGSCYLEFSLGGGVKVGGLSKRMNFTHGGNFFKPARNYFSEKL